MQSVSLICLGFSSFCKTSLLTVITRIAVQNVRIAGTAGNVDEVVTLKGFDNKPMVDVAGSSVRWDELHKNGVYTPNALHKP